jgi:hypothetical protein
VSLCVYKCIVQELVINKSTFVCCVQPNNLVSEPTRSGQVIEVSCTVWLL